MLAAVSRSKPGGQRRYRLAALLVLPCALACGEQAGWQPPPDEAPAPVPTAQQAQRPTELEGPSRILGWSIHHEEGDHLLLDVEYLVTGAEGRAVIVSATPLKGKYSVPSRVIPELASVGRHTARIYLGGQPDRFPFTSDSLRFSLYPVGKSVFTTLDAAYDKTWSASPAETHSQTP